MFISGQIPQTRDGVIPATFDSQCRLAWDNVIATLAAADLTVEHLVKVTTYLNDRRDRDANSRIRSEVLGAHRLALTIIITGIYDPAWLLEIEAVAAAPRR